ncbi:peroxisomal carnitine O-octanoyltransferase [Pyxicephalus adspersus]|uniref:peroxisomal carnitine O-octanoyltransferase n=1 Tax=Pyxicephalus adspersus TaxID=30357 RepID=UPI003B5BD017
MENRVLELVEERTFQYQESLPALPVPALEESLSKYCESAMYPTQRNLTAFETVLRSLNRPIHVISQIYEILIKHHTDNTPTFTRYWEKDLGEAISPLDWEKAFILTHKMSLPCKAQETNYKILSRWEKLAVHKSGNKPLDMHQFRNLFNTCKIPGVTRDSIINYFKTESEGSCPTHLIVMCRGRIFSFEAVIDGQMLSPPEILRQFSYVQNICQSQRDGIGLSALTSEERTRWALSREHLISLDPKNLSHLERIQSSLFIVSLDEDSPHGTPEDYSQFFPALNNTNSSSCRCKTNFGEMRSHNFSVCVFQHAPFDAMVLVAMCDYIDQNVKACEGRWKGPMSVRDMPYPEELVFTVDQKILDDIALAKAQYYTQASDLEVANYAFTSFGKALVKKKKLHPDTFVQLALQLAYYKLHGRPGCCYETATTRMFYHGRTETMRPCTMEAMTWCRSMLDPSSTVCQAAVLVCSSGYKFTGFDRHLLGLLLIAKEQGMAVPELFTDPAFTKSGGGGNFVLSTSLVGYTNVHGAVVPMIHDGYGFFYRIRDDRFVATCTAWKSSPETNADKLLRTVFENFQEMIQLMVNAQL